MNNNKNIRLTNPTVVCTLTVDKSTATISDILTYTATIENKGITSATNAMFKGSIPNETTFQANSITVNGSIVTGGTLNGVNIGDIPTGGSKTVNFKANVDFMPDVNPIVSSCYVTYNNPTENTNKSFAVTTVQFPHLTIIENLIDRKILPNGSAARSVKIINDGNILAESVQYLVTINENNQGLSSNLKLNGVDTGFSINNPINLAPINPGEKFFLDYYIFMNTNSSGNTGSGCANIGSETTANFTLASGTVRKTFESNVSTEQLKENYVVPDEITNIDIAEVNDVIKYTMTIYPGMSNYTNVIFKSILPPQVKFVQGSFVEDGVTKPQTPPLNLNQGVSLSNINLGTKKEIAYSLQVINSLPYVDSNMEIGTIVTGRVSASPPTFHIGGPVISTYICKYSLEVCKAVNSINAKVGDEIACVVSVRNSGNWEAENVIITDYIPAGLSFVPNTVYINSIFNGSADPTQGIDFGNISVYEIINIKYTVKVDFLPLNNTASTIATANANFQKETGTNIINKSFNSNVININISNP